MLHYFTLILVFSSATSISYVDRDHTAQLSSKIAMVTIIKRHNGPHDYDTKESNTQINCVKKKSVGKNEKIKKILASKQFVKDKGKCEGSQSDIIRHDDRDEDRRE